jgi:hypothetical protein
VVEGTRVVILAGTSDVSQRGLIRRGSWDPACRNVTRMVGTLGTNSIQP